MSTNILITKHFRLFYINFCIESIILVLIIIWYFQYFHVTQSEILPSDTLSV